MPITPLPTPPSRQDAANFAVRGDAFMGALPDFATEANALQADVNAKQATASAAAATATAKAGEAADAAGTATTQAGAASASAGTATTKAGEASASAAAALASKNAAAASAASITVQASPTDATAGRLMPVGAFGLGGAINQSTSLDDAPNGFFYALASATGSPDPTTGILHGHTNSAPGTATKLQWCTNTASGRTFIRNSNGSSWSAWREIPGYETGTFTPAIVGTATPGVGTYAYQVGRYIRIGKRVFVDMLLEWSAHTGTGSMEITGLPYTVLPGQAVASVPMAAFSNNLVIGTGKVLAAIGNVGTTKCLLYTLDQAGGVTLPVAMDAAASVRLSGSYEVA